MVQEPDPIALIPLAAVLEHDANNLIGKLYAAADWLGGDPEASALDEARLALADAVGVAHGLQAIFHLQALGHSHDGAASSQLFTRDEQSRLLSRLAESASVQAKGPKESLLDARITIGSQTLAAVLISAARLLRRRCGAKALIQLDMERPSPRSVQFILRSDVDRAPDARESQRPEVLALALASANLKAMGANWTDISERAGSWCLTLSWRNESR